jgi:hypothetical protein
MRPPPSALRLADAKSLLLKTSVAIPPKRGRYVPRIVKSTETAYSRPLATREGLKLLRQVSARVDRMLRSSPNQVGALQAVLWCRDNGVLQKHLPVLPSARTLKRVADRGIVESAKEARLVESVLSDATLVAELGPWAEVLGQALDPWYTKLASRKPSSSSPEA